MTVNFNEAYDPPHRMEFDKEHHAWVHGIYHGSTCEEIEQARINYHTSPRECGCGRTNGDPTEVRTCAYGNCFEGWCLCGTFLNMGHGPVGCPCNEGPPWEKELLSREDDSHPFFFLICKRCNIYAKYCPCAKPELTEEEWARVHAYQRSTEDVHE